MVVGESGIKQIFQTGVDLTGASAITLLLEDPFGNKSTRVMTFDPVNTQNPYYITLSTDYIVAGFWQAQVQAVLPTATLLTQVASFQVFPNIK